MTRFTQGQRKTILYLSLLLASALLVALTDGRMTGDQFVALHTVCFIAVVAGNAAEHMAKRGATEGKP